MKKTAKFLIMLPVTMTLVVTFAAVLLITRPFR